MHGLPGELRRRRRAVRRARRPARLRSARHVPLPRPRHRVEPAQRPFPPSLARLRPQPGEPSFPRPFGPLVRGPRPRPCGPRSAGAGQPVRRALTIAGCGLAACAALACLGTTAGVGPSRAPDAARSLANPFRDDASAAAAGRKLFERHCAHCHETAPGAKRRAPALDAAALGNVSSGTLFWFVTNGNLRGGMPAWSRLPRAQRWQLVAYLQASHPRGR
ncbi:MAG: cytochrome c [Acidobacteria bacterium]|nr:MAG: cytochrome c [Acidobacteriota bacterium]